MSKTNISHLSILSDINKPRYDSIDFLKGIGILFVVWGHTPLSCGKDFIYSFHMPLFAFVAGLFFQSSSFKTFVIKKSKRLLVPFYFWSFFFWVLYATIIYWTSPELMSNHLKRIFYIIAGSGQNSVMEYANLALWFLPFLFSISFIHYFIDKWIHRKWVDYAFVIIISLLAIVCGRLDIPIPFSIDTAMALYPFFYIATRYIVYIDPKIKDIKILHKWILFGLLIAVHLTVNQLNTPVDTASNEIGNYFYFYISAFSAIGYWTLFANMINRVNFINYLGRHSMTILIFHMPIILLISSSGFLKWIKSPWVTDLIFPTIVLFLCIPFIYFIDKYFPILIGQKSIK